LRVTYLSFSDFETRLGQVEKSSKNISSLASAIKEDPTLLLGQGADSEIIWKYFISPLPRPPRFIQDISYNFGGIGRNSASNSSVLGEKFCLLNYIVENWLWHTRYFLQDIPETSVSLIRFRSILSQSSLLFEITLWGTSTFSATSSHPDFPQEYLSWLETVLS
jgi:hypothetical protein